MNPEIDAKIRAAIDALERDYQAHQGLILTEGDLQCALYRRLCEIPEFVEPDFTADAGVTAPSLHAEISWYNRQGKLGVKPDFTILTPHEMSIHRGIGAFDRLPSKGFSFTDAAILFELKFAKGNTGVTRTNIKTIRGDHLKIRTLLEKQDEDGAGSGFYCYFVVFSKVDRQVPEFEVLRTEIDGDPRMALIYRTANVQPFPRVRR